LLSNFKPTKEIINMSNEIAKAIVDGMSMANDAITTGNELFFSTTEVTPEMVEKVDSARNDFIAAAYTATAEQHSGQATFGGEFALGGDVILTVDINDVDSLDDRVVGHVEYPMTDALTEARKWALDNLEFDT